MPKKVNLVMSHGELAIRFEKRRIARHRPVQQIDYRLRLYRGKSRLSYMCEQRRPKKTTKDDEAVNAASTGAHLALTSSNA